MERAMETVDVLKLARESLEELVADPQCDFGPAYEGMKGRQAKALKAVKQKIKELNDNTTN